MSFLVILLASLIVGVILAEISIRTFGGMWFGVNLGKIKVLLHGFWIAEDDDARQALALRCGFAIIQFSLVLLLLLFGLAAVAFVAPWELAWVESQNMIYFVVTSIVATGWWFLRLRSGADSSASLAKSVNTYSLFERWFHWLALEPEAVRHFAFDLERQFSLPKYSALTTLNSNKMVSPSDGAVYVCGLARSGTTMLLRILDEVDTFRSLTYRDMPFVLAPNLWRKITRYTQHRSNPTERAHGDGILVDFDSPEGLEEVFWRTFGTRTSDPRCLGVDEPSPDVLADFADYRALVANPQTEPVPANGILRRYLSKNNNNLLRLSSLCADPTASVLLVYRNPIATAHSLYRQHKRFCAAQTEDRFTRIYMGWLAHYEFGLDHRPFCFAVPEMDISLTPEDPNYWLDYWSAVYSHVLAQKDLRLLFVNHDELRSTPVNMIESILASLGVSADTEVLAQQIAPPTSEAENTDCFCPELLSRAEAIYTKLLSNEKNISWRLDKVKTK